MRSYDGLRSDIYRFADACNFDPSAQQRELLDAVMAATYADHRDIKKRSIAVKSGQGPGKTAAEVLAALWRSFRRPGAPTILIAPTERQAKDRWMAEARTWHGRMHPDLKRLFSVGASRVTIMGERDWCIRYSLASKAENVQGEHAVGQTIILDEASGIERPIIETVLGTQTDPDALTIFCGNPNTRDCGFFDCFNRDRVNWTCLTWNAEDSPRVNQANVERIAKLYGRNSDVYKVRVLGEFPSQDPQSVMSADDCEACTRNDMLKASRSRPGKQFGIDLARFGNDECVIYRRSGAAIVEERIFNGLEIDAAIAEAFRMQHVAGWRNEDVWYVADADGLGQGAMNQFYRAKKRLSEFHFGGRAHDSRIYYNRITEAFFVLGGLVKERVPHLPDDDRLIQQLSARQYFPTADGRIVVESKEEFKKRVQDGSPDRADAMVMTYFDRFLTAAKVAGVPKKKRPKIVRSSR